MILVDYTQIAVAGIMQFENDLKTGSDGKIVDLIRHVVLTSLLSNKRKFGKKYGDLTICTDGKSYWRKDVFEFYKGMRKKNREDSPLDWDLIFDTINNLKYDLAENFPYRVVMNHKAEADDIIGVLCKYFQTNELMTYGLEEDPQPILILSSDKDNLQMQKYRNVSQWSPMQKKAVKPEFDAHKSLIEKICTGDAGDGIPNIMSQDDSFVSGIRQKPFRKDRLDDFYKFGIGACNNDLEKARFQRNEMLVDYEKIPFDLQLEIINTYTSQPVVRNKTKIMNYLMKHRCRNLMENIEDF